LLISKQNPIRANAATTIRYYPDRLLAGALAAGHDLRTAAERLKITHETSRGHLKAIFSKADVNRQSELAALIARLRTPKGA
jgi:DNA-binding NarL/FixJ family response regulator